jgi:hypothetical protein
MGDGGVGGGGEAVGVVPGDVGPELGDALGNRLLVKEDLEAGLGEESHGSR